MSNKKEPALPWRVIEWKRNLDKDGFHYEVTICIWDEANNQIMWGLKRKIAEEIVEQHNTLLELRDLAERVYEEWDSEGGDDTISTMLLLRTALEKAGVR